MLRPLLRFAWLGAALFAVEGLWGSVEPPVVIPRARVVALQRELAGVLGHEPSAEELERALAPEVDDALLVRAALARGYERDDPVVFRRLVQNLRFAGAPAESDDASLFEEALAIGLHRTDSVVRRRLAQRMRLELEAPALAERPDEAALRAHYERHRERFHSPARSRVTQLYFRREHAAQARRELARLRRERVTPEAARARGDAFLYPADQPPQTQGELADRFGAEFADAVAALEAAVWAGPIASAYGVHLVWVHEREPARDLSFEEVRDSLRHAVLAEQRQRALARGLAALRNGAVVELE